MADIFLSYRHVEPDQSVAKYLYNYLSDHGHDVFWDQGLRAGDKWHDQIQENVSHSTYFIALVSLTYFNSSYIVKNEFAKAVELFEDGQINRIIQINLAFDGEAPVDVRKAVEAIQHFKWRSADDTALIAEKTLAVLPPTDLLLRGMRAYSDSDDKLFSQLGRASDVDDWLRLLRDAKAPYIIIHGVSGAGKSSFVRAGLIPKLDGKATAIELNRDNVDRFDPVTLDSKSIIFVDQFEQLLRQFARDTARLKTLISSLSNWASGNSERILVFCIRDEYRTSFETMLPEVTECSAWFPLLPLEPETASGVLGLLLKNVRVEFDDKFAASLCKDELSEGTPPRVLPAILQLIAQYCRNHQVPLSRSKWADLSANGRSLFEEHITDTVFNRLPARVSRLNAAQTLAAVTSGEVRSRPKTVDEIVSECGLKSDAVISTLETASLPHSRVVVLDIESANENSKTKYRLVHDLFAPAVHILHQDAVLRRKNLLRRAVIVVLTTLLIGAGYYVFRVTQFNRALALARDRQAGRTLLAQANNVRDTLPQTSLLLTLEAMKILPKDEQNLTSPVGQALVDGLRSIGGAPLSGHSEPLRGMEVSPGGKWIFTWTTRSAILWFLKDDKPIRTDCQIEGSVVAAAFSPDEGQLVVDADKTIIFDLTTFPVQSSPLALPGEDYISSVGFDRSGKWLLTSGYLWVRQNQKLTSTLVIGKNYEHAFSPDNQWLAISGSNDLMFVSLANGENGKPSQTTIPNSSSGSDTDLSLEAYTKLRFSRSGKLLFAQRSDLGAFFIWRMDKGGVRQPLEISYGTGGNPPTLKFADVSGDEEWLVTILEGEATFPVNLWNLRTGSKKPLTLSPFNRSIDVATAWQIDEHLVRQLMIAQVSLDPRGERLIITNLDNEVQVWDLRNVNERLRPLVLPCDSYGTSLGFLEDRLYVGTLAGPILEWTLSSSNPLKTRRAFNGHELIVSALSTVPGAGLMISAAIEGADVYNAPGIDLPEIRVWRPLESGTGMIPIRLKGHTARPYGAMFSPDGRWLLTVGVTGFLRYDNRAVLWDFSKPDRPRASRVIEEHKTGVIVAAIGNNRAFTVGGINDLLSSTYERDVYMWALSDPQKAPVVLEHSASVHSLTVSSNDNWLVTDATGEAWLWDLRKPEPRNFSGEELGGAATSIAIAPDENHACVGFADGTVRLYDITGDHPRQVGGGREHSDRITSVAFITRDELVSVARSDSVLRYWKLGEPRSIGQFDLGAVGLEQPVVSIRVTNHRRWLITEGQAKLYLYDLQTRPDQPVDLSEYNGEVLFSSDDRWLALVNEGSTAVFDLFRGVSNPTKIGEGAFGVDLSSSSALLTSGSNLLITYLKQMTRIRDLNKIVRNSFESLDVPGEAMIAATSPDGRYLVTVWEDVSIWPLDFEDLKRRAEQAAGRDLTPNERTLYGLAPAQNN